LSHDELREFLVQQEGPQLRAYAEHLLNPDVGRTLVVTAHLVVERLLGDMIATRLSHPNCWLDEADFRARTNLARALGLIGEDELAICRVLGAARNCIAHQLAPLPEKWGTELHRLAHGRKARSTSDDVARPSLHDTLRELLTKLAAPWLYARTQAKLEVLRKENGARWKELMAKRLEKELDLENVLEDDSRRDALILEVELALAKELAGKAVS
jgi:hypothetical protein